MHTTFSTKMKILRAMLDFRKKSNTFIILNDEHISCACYDIYNLFCYYNYEFKSFLGLIRWLNYLRSSLDNTTLEHAKVIFIRMVGNQHDIHFFPNNEFNWYSISFYMEMMFYDMKAPDLMIHQWLRGLRMRGERSRYFNSLYGCLTRDTWLAAVKLMKRQLYQQILDGMAFTPRSFECRNGQWVYPHFKQNLVWTPKVIRDIKTKKYYTQLLK